MKNKESKNKAVVFPFGKYINQRVEDVPTSYLRWLLNTDWFEEQYPELVEPVDEELEIRSAHRTHF